MDNKFSTRLKELRTKSKKTQAEVADLLNIKRSTYGEYERGKIMPPVDKIEQLASIFNVKPHYLIGWDIPDANKNLAPSPLAVKIKQMREAKHKTLTEMAEEIGIDKGILSKYENGESKIPYTAIKKLAIYFDISLNILYGMEFDLDPTNKEEIKAGIRRLKMAEMWNQALGKEIFAEDELHELMNFARYIIYKRDHNT